CTVLSNHRRAPWSALAAKLVRVLAIVSVSDGVGAKFSEWSRRWVHITGELGVQRSPLSRGAPMPHSRLVLPLPILGLMCFAALAACTHDSASPASPGAANSLAGPVRPELAKIQHIVIIMQENRSFDHYFGTFPGADGIPMANGVPTVCVNDP